MENVLLMNKIFKFLRWHINLSKIASIELRNDNHVVINCSDGAIINLLRESKTESDSYTCYNPKDFTDAYINLISTWMTLHKPESLL